MSTPAEIGEYAEEVSYEVLCVISVEGTEEETLQRAASVNYLGDFSVAQALVREARKRGIPPLPASKFESIPGKGVKALIADMEVRVGSPRFLIEERIAVPVSFAEKISAFARDGRTVIAVLSGRSLSGAIILAKMQKQKSSKNQGGEKSGWITFKRTTSVFVLFAVGFLLVSILILYLVL